MGRFADLWASVWPAAAKRPAAAEMQQQEDNAGQGKAVIPEKLQLPDLGPTVASTELYTPPELLAIRKEAAVSSYSREILNTLRARRGKETGRWLQTLAKESLPADRGQQDAPALSQALDEDEVAWIDALFNQFIRLSFEFNKSASGTRFMVSCRAPELHVYRSEPGAAAIKPESAISPNGPSRRLYQGRIMTRNWTLGVRGGMGRISFFLLPAELSLAFDLDRLDEMDHPPFMELTQELTDQGSSVWQLGGEPATLATVPHLARELFGDLIRVASGVMSESELFMAHTEEPVLGKNLAIGYEARDESAGTAEKELQLRSSSEMKVSDACDLVDDVIEQELKQLYDKAAQLLPGAAEMEAARKKISALESFRTRVLDAFAQYTLETHGESGKAGSGLVAGVEPVQLSQNS